MPKKKMVEEVIMEEPAYVVIDTITVKSVGFFKDGGLSERFAAEGLKLEWPAGEIRAISKALYHACVESGAKFEVV